MRAAVIGEGGNLGLTQRARIEYALNGGRINADFIDNATGVATSDREVNLKVALDAAVASGELPAAERNTLLARVQDEIGESVLADAASQTLAISLAEVHAPFLLGRHERLIENLERDAGISRAAEVLPSAAELSARHRAGQGLVRPEIAVLLAQSKNLVVTELLASPVPRRRRVRRCARRLLPGVHPRARPPADQRSPARPGDRGRARGGRHDRPGRSGPDPPARGAPRRRHPRDHRRVRGSASGVRHRPPVERGPHPARCVPPHPAEPALRHPGPDRAHHVVAAAAPHRGHGCAGAHRAFREAGPGTRRRAAPPHRGTGPGPRDAADPRAGLRAGDHRAVARPADHAGRRDVPRVRPRRRTRLAVGTVLRRRDRDRRTGRRWPGPSSSTTCRSTGTA